MRVGERGWSRERVEGRKYCGEEGGSGEKEWKVVGKERGRKDAVEEEGKEGRKG